MASEQDIPFPVARTHVESHCNCNALALHFIRFQHICTHLCTIYQSISMYTTFVTRAAVNEHAP